jgi:hypothetical protein
VIRTDLRLTWPQRLFLLLGGKLSVSWYAGATGPKIARIHVAWGPQ